MLHELRHACQRCGASCTGHRVLLQAGEAERMVRYGGELGIPEPLEGGTLRQVDGRCVFLTGDRLCAVHARAGLAAKPLACRQYPLVVVRAEDEVRVGLDPGCLTTWQSWRSGPVVTPERALAARVVLPGDQQAEEAGVLRLCETADTVRALVEALAGPDWIDAWADGCQRVGLPVPESRPDWALGREGEALAVETVRRMVHLRLASERGSPRQVALAVLGGALLAGWQDPGLAAFGTGLANWCRAVRLPGLWGAVAEALP